MRVSFLIVLFISLLHADAGFAAIMDKGQTIATFDPYGNSQEEAVSESTVARRLQPSWSFLYTYGFTYRTRLSQAGALLDNTFERNHNHMFGVDFRPSKYFFAGIGLPLIQGYFERRDTSENKYSYDEIGFGDIYSYMGTTMPWIPLSITGVLLFPTGNYEKGMGTGEFSGGFAATFRYSLGEVETNLGGFYFFVSDPESKASEAKVELPDIFGASIHAATQITPWFRPGVGFEWTRSMIITMDTVHLLKPSVKVTWRITDWLFAVTGFGMEVFPVLSYNPNVSLIFNL